MRKLLWRWLPVIIWLGVIFGGSSIGSLPRADSALLDALVHRIAHVLEFALLGLLLLRAISERGSITWRQVISAALLCGLYGVTDEWHQAYVPGRSSELSAVPFDFGGGLIGALVWRWWIKNLSGFPR